VIAEYRSARHAPARAPAVVLARGQALAAPARFADQLLIALSSDTSSPFGPGFAAATLTPQGATAAWIGTRTVHGVVTGAVRTATGPAPGGVAERSVIGGGLRDAGNLAGYTTAEGNPGVAWLEEDGKLVHAALPGIAPPSDAPVPAVRVRRLGPAVVRFSRPLVLHVTCSAACEVRGQIPGRADGRLSLDHAGHGLLRIGPIIGLRGAERTLTVRLIYGAPGALHPQGRTLHVRLREAGVPVIRRAREVRATRAPGDRIRVTWTSSSSRQVFGYVVTASATRGGPPRAVNATFQERGAHFAVTLHHVRGLRFATVSPLALDVPGLPRPVEVRVR
jgi:hypothetical protein